MPSAQYVPAAQGVHMAPAGLVPGAQRAFSAPLVAGQTKPVGLRAHMHIHFHVAKPKYERIMKGR
jgi:hypothetical protein